MPGVSEGRPPCTDRRRRTRCLCAGCASPRARRRPRGGRSRPRASPSRARHATSAGSPPRWSTRRTPPGRTPRTCAPCAACSRGVPVRVVVVPPLVRRGLRAAPPRGLPLLLAPERGGVEGAPRGAPVLVAPAVDEVGAVDPVAVVADEGVVPVPLAHVEVRVEVVGDRVPGDELPAH